MHSDSIDIKKIRSADPEFAAVYELRETVLRQPLGLSLKDEDLSGDAEDDIFIALSNAEVIGCLMRKPLDNGVVKLRQMAVAPSAQGRGIGRLLLMAAEQDAQKQGYKLISLHARKNVSGFYTALGYQTIGDEFEEVTIPHLLMEKQL